MRFYAACLSSYNNGILHGAWIDADTDTDAMQEEVNAMLEASPMQDAEEWAVHDYDDDTGASRGLGEYPGLQAIAELAQALDDIALHDNIPQLVAWLDGNSVPVAEWVDKLDDCYMGKADSPSDYVAGNVDDSEVPEHLRNYIDYDQMARDWALQEYSFVCCYTGAYLQDYNQMSGRECMVFVAS